MSNGICTPENNKLHAADLWRMLKSSHNAMIAGLFLVINSYLDTRNP